MTVDTVYARVEAASTAAQRELIKQSRAGHTVTAYLDAKERLGLALFLMQDIASDLNQVLGSATKPTGSVAELVRSARDAALAVSHEIHQDWWRVVAAVNAATHAVPRG